jgi:hypothetical protein
VEVAHALLEVVQARWRRLKRPRARRARRAGTEFIDGKLQERDDHEREFEGAPP